MIEEVRHFLVTCDRCNRELAFTAPEAECIPNGWRSYRYRNSDTGQVTRHICDTCISEDVAQGETTARKRLAGVMDNSDIERWLEACLPGTGWTPREAWENGNGLYR